MPHKIVLMLMIESDDDGLDPKTLPAQNATEAHRLALIERVRGAHPGDYTMLAIMGEDDAEQMCKLWMQVRHQAAAINGQQKARRPNHWMTETSGILRNAVTAYLEPLVIMTPAQVGVMKEYLAMWMQGDWKGPGVDDLRSTVKDIRNKRDLRQWLDRAADLEIDPL